MHGMYKASDSSSVNFQVKLREGELRHPTQLQLAVEQEDNHMMYTQVRGPDKIIITKKKVKTKFKGQL